MKKTIGLAVLILLFIPVSFSQAQKKALPVYIFTSQGCPHCAKAKAFIETAKQNQYPEINMLEFDLKTNPEYVGKYIEFAQAYGLAPKGVPITYIGDKVIEGDQLDKIQNALENCQIHACPDPDQLVKDYLVAHPITNKTNTATSPKEIIGWIIIIGAIVGGVGLIILKK